MNLAEAVELLDVVSEFSFEATEKIPDLHIYDNQKYGFVLCVKADLVSKEYRNYIEEIVNSRNLRVRETEGYLMIYG